MTEKGLTKNQIISELSKSAHGALHEYIPVGKAAAEQHAEFFAHLIAWDRIKGQIDDAKLALPIVSLFASGYPAELIENSLACLTLLNPRDMLRALRFILDVRNGKSSVIVKTEEMRGKKKCVVKKQTYVNVQPMHLRSLAEVMRIFSFAFIGREKNWPKWERTMLQHRAVLRDLFALLRIHPRDQRTKACLFKCDKINGKRVKLPYPEGGLFETVSRLKDMSPQEAAGTIMAKKIPFLIALGALGAKANEPDLVLALIKSMTAKELVNNTKMLEGMGVKTNPALRGAFQEALEKAGKSKANVLKTTAAAEAIDDEELRDKLRGLQEKQIQTLGGVDGDWLVLGDKSGSMSRAIEAARQVAATLAKMVKGKVWLTFFDTQPQTIDVTGAPLDVIKKATQYITAEGGTSIGCGLQRMLDGKTLIDGIAIVSDGGDNTAPYFHDVYGRYSEFAGKQVPVYLYLLAGEGPYLPNFMQQAGYDLQIFDLRGQETDYYALPNLVATMRTNRYSLVDEIMATKLLTLPDAYKTPLKKAATA